METSPIDKKSRNSREFRGLMQLHLTLFPDLFSLFQGPLALIQLLTNLRQSRKFCHPMDHQELILEKDPILENSPLLTMAPSSGAV